MARNIRMTLQPGAIFFLDTNIFTTRLDKETWDLFLSTQVLIAPTIWKELHPWLKTPRVNQEIRDLVLKGINRQVSREPNDRKRTIIIHPASVVDEPRIEVVFIDDEHLRHGYNYYYRLLALRKLMGPITVSVLKRELGRPPTDDEFLAEAQGRFGERGFHLAKKGIARLGAFNQFADEELLLFAVLTAIIRGAECYIVTRDTDVIEQFFKLSLLLKEHYRCMLAAEKYAANPSSMVFQEVFFENDGVHVPIFEQSPILQYSATEIEFAVLPSRFHPVNIHCLLFGGDEKHPKVSYTAFSAEREMAKVLRIKAATGGRSTDLFGDRNCTIRGVRFTPEQHRIVVWIGKETTVDFGPAGRFGVDDFYNTLFCNEQFAHSRKFEIACIVPPVPGLVSWNAPLWPGGNWMSGRIQHQVPEKGVRID